VSNVFTRILGGFPHREDTSITAVEQIELAATSEPTHLGPHPASPLGMLQDHLQGENTELEDMGDDINDQNIVDKCTAAVADFFTVPSPSLLASQQVPAGNNGVPAPASPTPTPTQTRRRSRRVFDMSKVRRSARLATAPRIPAIQKAQRNLCRKLGLLDSELQPIEAALQDFIAMFDGPLLQEIIAALTAMFNIDDDNAEEIDRTLVGLVDDGVAELEEVVGEMKARAGATLSATT